MKTSLRILAHIALFLLGTVGICGLLGEPTDAYWAWMHRTFGVFGFVWFFFEKVFWACLLAGVYHLWTRLNLKVKEELA